MLGALTSGWHRIPVEGGLLLVAPDPRLGVIRVRTGLPLRPVREVVTGLIGAPAAGHSTVEHAPPRAFVTAEGEHAALFELVVHAPRGEIRRAIAIILGDAELVALDGRGAAPEAFDIASKVEAAARAFTLGLGSDRWRRVSYDAPAGWQRLARFRADLWLPPDHPRNDGQLTVGFSRPIDPATPVTQHARLFEHIGGDYGKVPPHKHAVTLPSGLSGEALTYDALVEGRPRRSTHVTLGHHRRALVVRLDTSPEHAPANLSALRALLESCRPIPTPSQSTEAFSLWSD